MPYVHWLMRAAKLDVVALIDVRSTDASVPYLLANIRKELGPGSRVKSTYGPPGHEEKIRRRNRQSHNSRVGGQIYIMSPTWGRFCTTTWADPSGLGLVSVLNSVHATQHVPSLSLHTGPAHPRQRMLEKDRYGSNGFNGQEHQEYMALQSTGLKNTSAPRSQTSSTGTLTARSYVEGTSMLPLGQALGAPMVTLSDGWMKLSYHQQSTMSQLRSDSRDGQEPEAPAGSTTSYTQKKRQRLC